MENDFVISVTVIQSGAVQIVLKKENPLIHWPSLGEILEQNFTKTHPGQFVLVLHCFVSICYYS